MTYLEAIILGIVEGLTEFLPISSTAHITLASALLKIETTEFLKSFEIVIQAGAILAVIVVYFGLLIRNKELWKRVIVAFLPTGAVGFVLYKIIKGYLLHNIEVIAWALAIGGALLIIFEYFFNHYEHNENEGEKNREEGELSSMPYMTAFWIGLAQSIAVVPGVSRAAATIVAGRLLGVGRVAIVEFSFFLAVPTILAASGYELLKGSADFAPSEYGLVAVGFIVSFLFALIAIKFMIAFIKTHSFTLFGVYRIALAVLVVIQLLP